MHPFFNFLQALTAKETESQKVGLASEKSCTRPRQSLELIDRGNISDLSVGEGDSRSPSSSSLDSLPKWEAETLPRSIGTPVNYTLKKGMPF